MTVDVKKVYEEISADEGKILHKYLCSESHPTIGIGHKVLDDDAAVSYTHLTLPTIYSV